MRRVIAPLHARLVELAYTQSLNLCADRLVGSSPTVGTSCYRVTPASQFVTEKQDSCRTGGIGIHGSLKNYCLRA